MSDVVWITGAHGFIGRHVAKAFARRGAIVLGVGHGAWAPSEAERWGVSHWVNGEVEPNNLHALRGSAGIPTTIVHLAGGSSVGAALTHPREDFFRTVGTTAELLEWVRQESPDAAVIAVSSAAVYGAGHGGPISEEAPLNPFSPYGHNKAMMESLCRSYGASYGLRSIIARLFSVYGAGLKKQLLWDMCSRLELAAPALELGGSGDELRDWIEVGDVANVLIGLATHASATTPAVNVGSGHATSVRDVARQLIEFWARRTGAAEPSLRFNGRARAGDPFSLVADVHRLEALGGRRCPTQLAQGLEHFVDWYARQREREA